MLKEINEQPKVLSDIFKRYMKDDTLGISLNFGDYDKIHIVACGSAMHAGLVGKYLFENYADVDVTVEIAPEVRPSRSSRTKDRAPQISCAHDR